MGDRKAGNQLAHRHLISVIDSGACGYFRLLQGANVCVRDLGYPAEAFRLHKGSVAEWISQYDTLTAQRHTDHHLSDIQIAKAEGKLCVHELDDLDIHLPPSNPLADVYRDLKWSRDIYQITEMCDAVTVSTPQLAMEYQKMHPKKPIEIIENAIDTQLPMWNLPRIPHPHGRVTIIWAGSPTHLHDLELIHGVFSSLVSYGYRITLLLCGFVPNVTRIVVDENGKKRIEETKANPIDRRSWWGIIHPFLDLIPGKDPGSIIHMSKAEKRIEKSEEGGKDVFVEIWGGQEIQDWQLADENLQVFGSLPIDLYPQIYRYADIVVAPQLDSRFARCKSPLKLLEAWAYRLPIVASPVLPYVQAMNHKVDGFLAGNGKDFIKYLRKLIENEGMRCDMGAAGHEKLLAKWEAQSWAKKRYDWYDYLLDRK